MQDFTPTVQIDSREQLPLDVQGFPTEVVGLPVGDYGVKGFSDWTNPQFIVERKSLSDLISSLTSGRERFDREVLKLRQFGFRALLIEAVVGECEFAQYRSSVKPATIFQSLAAYQVRTNLHVLWCGSHQGAARQLEMLVRQFTRGITKDFRRLENACLEPESVEQGG